MALCPYCKAKITSVRAEDASVATVGMAWNGVSYSCPSCQSVLSVGIDQISLKADIVKEILKEIRKR
jgi:hypothetical protein